MTLNDQYFPLEETDSMVWSNESVKAENFDRLAWWQLLRRFSVQKIDFQNVSLRCANRKGNNKPQNGEI
jgi:hypothetical protein